MIKNYALRFPDEEEQLFEAIKKSAKNNRRSFNAEILHALDFYLKNAPEAHYQVKPLPKEGKRIK